MSMLDALGDRHSLREYKRESLPRSTIEALVRAATLAPSAMNEQPWHFTIVQNQTLLDTISDGAKAHVLSSSLTMPEPMRAMLQDRAFQIFYQAPALIVISAPETL